MNERFEQKATETDRVDFETHRDEDELEESKVHFEDDSQIEPGNFDQSKPKLSTAVQQHILQAEMEDQGPNPFDEASSDDHNPIEGIVGKMTVEEARQSLKEAGHGTGAN